MISLQVCMHGIYESCRHVADGTKRSAVKQPIMKTALGRLSKLLTAAIPSHLRPHIDVISATKTVIPEFVSSATIDAATSEQEINKIKNKQNTLGLGFITHCHLWSTEASIFLFHQIIYWTLKILVWCVYSLTRVDLDSHKRSVG